MRSSYDASVVCFKFGIYCAQLDIVMGDVTLRCIQAVLSELRSCNTQSDVIMDEVILRCIHCALELHSLVMDVREVAHACFL